MEAAGSYAHEETDTCYMACGAGYCASHCSGCVTKNGPCADDCGKCSYCMDCFNDNDPCRSDCSILNPWTATPTIEPEFCYDFCDGCSKGGDCPDDCF